MDDHGRRVQSMFTDIAHGYDRANRVMSLGTDVRWRKRAVADLLEGCTSPAPRVLDLCAGTLDSSRTIALTHPKAQVVGGDFSAGMLEEGRRNLPEELAERVLAQQLDAHDLPFADESFDAIFCAFGIRNLSDVPRATAEQLRVLKPGARLTVLDFFRPTGLFSRTVHTLYNHTVLPAVGWAFTGNLDAYLYLPRSIGKFSTLGEYTGLLEGAGFLDATCEMLTMNVASIVRARKSKELPS